MFLGCGAYVRFIVFTFPSKLPVIFADWVSSDCCKSAGLIGILNAKGPAAADKLSPRKHRRVRTMGGTEPMTKTAFRSKRCNARKEVAQLERWQMECSIHWKGQDFEWQRLRSDF